MISEADEDRLTAVRAKPCICCQIEGVEQPLTTEAHHIVDKSYRKHSGGHQATIPLDKWHHRGICLPGVTAQDMRIQYGPSLALHKREFVETYGGERELLAAVNEGTDDDTLF